jgi:hypothetical protein
MYRYILLVSYFISIWGCNSNTTEEIEFQSLNVEEIEIKCPKNWIRKYNDKALLAFKLDSIAKFEYFIIMKTLVSPELMSIDDYLCKSLEKASNSSKYDLLGTSYHKVELKSGLICFAGHELTNYQNRKYISLNVISQIDSFYYKISLNIKENEVEKYSYDFNNILDNLIINNIKMNQSEVIRKIKIKTDSLCNTEFNSIKSFI